MDRWAAVPRLSGNMARLEAVAGHLPDCRLFDLSDMPVRREVLEGFSYAALQHFTHCPATSVVDQPTRVNRPPLARHPRDRLHGTYVR